jgi:hypothetical protein
LRATVADHHDHNDDHDDHDDHVKVNAKLARVAGQTTGRWS